MQAGVIGRGLRALAARLAVRRHLGRATSRAARTTLRLWASRLEPSQLGQPVRAGEKGDVEAALNSTARGKVRRERHS